MIKLSSPALLLAVAGAMFAGFGALAPVAANAASGSYYRAELAGPAPTAKFVARDVVWACDGANCGAGRGTSRPLLICSGLAKKAGKVKSFVADGKALEADDLARCNGAQ